MAHILVTGGSRGIGRKIVEKYLKEGDKVSFIYSSNYDEAELIKSFGESSDRIRCFRADVASMVKKFCRAYKNK